MAESLLASPPPTTASSSSSSSEEESTPSPSKELLEQNSEEEVEAAESEVETPSLDAGGRVSKKFCSDLVEFYKRQRRLPTATCHRILRDAKALLVTVPSLVEVRLGKDDVVNICGDIHGQFYDLARIFDLYGQPGERNQYLFNGDFVDRGPWSVEVLFLLLSLKLLHPRHFHLARGNHEAEEINKLYGFHAEVLDKYDSKMFGLIQEVFNWLPVAHCVNDSVLVMHGGLSCEDGVTLQDIRDIKRGRQPDRTGLMCDLLWSDPQEEEGRFPNHRGFSCVFGPDVTARFLEQNSLLYIVRSHECVQYGYDLCHDDKVVTVFSAPNYCDRVGNKGAICVLHGDDVSMPEFRKFEAAPHPECEDKRLKYASLLMRLQGLM